MSSNFRARFKFNFNFFRFYQGCIEATILARPWGTDFNIWHIVAKNYVLSIVIILPLYNEIWADAGIILGNCSDMQRAVIRVLAKSPFNFQHFCVSFFAQHDAIQLTIFPPSFHKY